MPRPPFTDPSPIDAALLAELTARAVGLVEPGRRAFLGITGAPGAGKTTLAERLVAALRQEPPAGLGGDAVSHVPMDGFHLADAQLERRGLRDRKGAPETFDGYGFLALLDRLQAETDHPVFVPGFERDLEQPLAAALAVEPDVRLVVTEGNYLLLEEEPWAAVRQRLDEVWFVQLPDDERLRRLVARHVEFGKSAEAAWAWVLGPDEANAGRILATSARADLVVAPHVKDSPFPDSKG